MKRINNYILEKLHISKDLKIDNIKVGMKLHVQADDSLFELIDFISADASDDEISAFLKKHKNVSNKSSWFEIKNYKLTQKGKESLDKFGYILILKHINNINNHDIMVYYNKQVFKPITEKLHLNKDYNVEHDDYEEEFEYLKKVMQKLIPVYVNIKPEELQFNYKYVDGGMMHFYMSVWMKYKAIGSLIRNLKYAMKREGVYDKYEDLQIFVNADDRHILKIYDR